MMPVRACHAAWARPEVSSTGLRTRAGAGAMGRPPGQTVPVLRTSLTSSSSCCSLSATTSAEGATSSGDRGGITRRCHAVGRCPAAAARTRADVAEAGRVARARPLCTSSARERVDRPRTTYLTVTVRAVVRTSTRRRPLGSTEALARSATALGSSPATEVCGSTPIAVTAMGLLAWDPAGSSTSTPPSMAAASPRPECMAPPSGTEGLRCYACDGR